MNYSCEFLKIDPKRPANDLLFPTCLMLSFKGTENSVIEQKARSSAQWYAFPVLPELPLPTVRLPKRIQVVCR